MVMTTEIQIERKPRGIFFDLYGTLLLFGDMKAAWCDWFDALYAALGSCGLAVSKGAVAEQCEGFFGKQAPPATNDGLSVFERRVQALAGAFGLTIRSQDIQRMAPGIVAAWQAHICPDPQAAEVLETLEKTKTLGLISNFDHPPHVRGLLRECGWLSYFTTIVISGDVGFKKPDPRIFQLALAETGFLPEEAVYVGDTEEDMKGARCAGMTSVLIARGENGTDPSLLDFTTGEPVCISTSAVKTRASVTTIANLKELIGIVRPPRSPS
jgi:putative hydrolase of the HAD superfamily